MNITSEYVFSRITPRNPHGHKGTFGRLLLLTGSGAYRGAAVLCAGGALGVGVGYAVQGAEESVCAAVLGWYPETVLCPLAGDVQQDKLLLERELERADAVVLGNGLGTSKNALALVQYVLGACDKPMVIDADGINFIAAHKLNRRYAAPTIYTPHKGELARLLACEASVLAADCVTPALGFGQKQQAVVVCKDAHTVTVTPRGEALHNTTGNAGLAKAGSGDVLAGIIGGLLAQGYDEETAAAAGVWLHGAAADAAAAKYSQHAMRPHHVSQCLGDVFLQYLGV